MIVVTSANVIIQCVCHRQAVTDAADSLGRRGERVGPAAPAARARAGHAGLRRAAARRHAARGGTYRCTVYGLK